jgi:hypothetical protein
LETCNKAENSNCTNYRNLHSSPQAHAAAYDDWPAFDAFSVAVLPVAEVGFQRKSWINHRSLVVAGVFVVLVCLGFTTPLKAFWRLSQSWPGRLLPPCVDQFLGIFAIVMGRCGKVLRFYPV